MTDLIFKDIPDNDAPAFIEGILDTLDQLGYTFDYDEAYPAVDGMTIYRVVNVAKESVPKAG